MQSICQDFISKICTEALIDVAFLKNKKKEWCPGVLKSGDVSPISVFPDPTN